MEWYYILIAIICSILILNMILTLIISYVCYKLTFFVDRKKAIDDSEMPIGDDFSQYEHIILSNMKKAKESEYQDFYITSFDGLKLHGVYFETFKGGPVEILFHGYRGSAFRDMSSGIERAKAVGRNALLVEQRTCGQSEGKVISFGINERHDCVSWINFVIKHFGENVEIYIGGVSMGGSTVLLASSMNLPSNVKGILADSSFFTAKDIIKKVVKDLKLPPNLCYPFIKLGAKLYGKFDLEETTAIESVKNTNIPIIFYHGEADAFVPCDMSVKLYMACSSKKKIVTIPKSGHGLCYLVEPERYVSELKKFIEH